MPEEQKPTADRPADKSPPKRSIVPGKWLEMFEFSKFMDKLPLQKLSARMAYCMFFDMVLLSFVLVLRALGIQVNEFPNSWDFRFIVVMTIVVFFVGLSDMWKGRGD
ncbi:hypothetical protein [Paenibacillus sedimenti]|uniref:Uncharacterized protein n=1 Tax=Paenibacillus sedimenti TaxID=2770274 RepID=A0A926KR87_9BACL|nr:hypothetical protein [Paenibacillus sedimenti]MBD0382594.1 hypothetical protein [Paenibacillus sedimenti]